MENTFYLLEELKKLQSSQLDYTISELKLVHRESLLAYVEEQFQYKYKNLLKEEESCKDQESVKKVYQKWFLKKEYAQSGLETMAKRIKKHLSKETSDALLPLCKELLKNKLNNRILSVLPDKQIWWKMILTILWSYMIWDKGRFELIIKR